MRIYATSALNPRATEVFFTKVKPVHERYGATFIGRYADEKGRVVVMWSYPDRATMVDVQRRVEEDQETISNQEIRRSAGLHGIPFEEFVLEPTIFHSSRGDFLPEML